jgi:hypothetical protein
MRWTQEHYDDMQELVASGETEAAAARELGIPTGTIGNLKLRFGSNGSVAPEESPIGGLAQELNAYTEELLELATQMSELTKVAHGLVMLDKTLGQLEARQQEAAGLRRRLGVAEKRLIARASVVHSND